MKIAFFFTNIGFYHLARLEAALEACAKIGWAMEAVQLTDNSLEHNWGDAARNTTVPINTLIPNTNASEHEATPQAIPSVSEDAISACFGNISPDVVFLPGWSGSASQKILKWARKNKIPAVVMSESKRDDQPRKFWKEAIKSWLYVSRFSAALVGGDAHANYVAELGIPKRKIFRGYDCIDNAYFEKAAETVRSKPVQTRKQNPKMPNGQYFLSAFRFMPRKNGLKLIQAYSMYQKFVDDPWDLVICGNGTQLTEMEQSIDSLELKGKVHLAGFLNYQEVCHWYGLANALVHPALQEQWGLVVNEACAAGLPILCSHTVGSAKHLVRDQENGYLFDPTNTEEISNAMAKLHKTDEDARARMGRLSQHLVAGFTTTHFASGAISAAMAATD